jgi:hypothetical protein
MPQQDTSRRIDPDYLEQGEDALAGLRTLADYQPQRSEASVVSIDANYQAMKAAQAAETAAKEQLQAATAAAREAEWKFHNSVLIAKTAVVAQYGDDSHQVNAIGWKRRSEYKPPTRKKKKVEA